LRPARADSPRPRHPGERQLRARLRSRWAGRVREDGRVDRGEPARVRDVPYSDAVSRHAALRRSRAAEPHRASRLAALRHGARRVRAEADDGRGALRRIRVVLPAAVLASVDLAPPSEGLAGGARLSRDVVLVQAIELDLALADPVAADRARLAPAD